MFLREADDLLIKHLQHPDFQKFENRTPRLQVLTRQIQDVIEKTDKSHFLGETFVEVDEKTKEMFLEFANICEQGLE